MQIAYIMAKNKTKKKKKRNEKGGGGGGTYKENTIQWLDY